MQPFFITCIFNNNKHINCELLSLFQFIDSSQNYEVRIRRHLCAVWSWVWLYFSLWYRLTYLAIFSEQVQMQVYSKGLIKPFSYDMKWQCFFTPYRTLSIVLPFIVSHSLTYFSPSLRNLYLHFYYLWLSWIFELQPF